MNPLTRHCRRLLAIATGCAMLATAAAGPTAAARGPIQGAPLLYALHGDATSVNFGWAVAELADVDGDGVTDLITSDPFRGAGPQVSIYSGADGGALFTFDGPDGEFYGYSIADAGDTDSDGVSDILIGDPGGGTAVPGFVELRSGADGTLLHRFDGDQPNSEFGTAVASAGDV